MRVIFLILIGFSSFIGAVGSINTDNFTRNNGVISDSATNLEWQDDYSDNNNSVKETTWQSAIDYCEALNLNNKSDWRLPNINELSSLLDDTKYNPAINDIFQNNNNSSNYWSSTNSSFHNGTNAWIIYLHTGVYGTSVKKDNSLSVRCVRAGQ